ncbi:unnamed protein product, partial [Rotaria magnacalcarata]
MSQNSSTKLSSDSNILHSLNTDCDSCQINEIDILISYSENDEDFNIHGQIENNIDMNLVAGDHQNIQ